MWAASVRQLQRGSDLWRAVALRRCNVRGTCAPLHILQRGRAVSTAYQSMEEAQEMLTLAQRHISDELLQQVERHQECFDMPKAPSRSGSEGAMVAMELFERLRRNPFEPPVSAERAEDMVIAMEGELQALKSPVLDVSLPQVGDDRRLVVVGDLHGQLQDILHVFEEHGPPSEEVAYVFNGDIVDRGRYAVEIWLLVIAFKLSHPQSVFVLRGNHENDQMISRPFKMGGGFSEECLGKYNHSLLAAFQRMFKLLPLFAVIEKEIFVVHGGLFRDPSVNLEMLRELPKVHWQRNYPNPLNKEEMEQGKAWTEQEEILFDALWADPHHGIGSKRSERGRVAVMFGEDVTERFLDDAVLRCVWWRNGVTRVEYNFGDLGITGGPGFRHPIHLCESGQGRLFRALERY